MPGLQLGPQDKKDEQRTSSFKPGDSDKSANAASFHFCPQNKYYLPWRGSDSLSQGSFGHHRALFSVMGCVALGSVLESGWMD